MEFQVVLKTREVLNMFNFFGLWWSNISSKKGCLRASSTTNITRSCSCLSLCLVGRMCVLPFLVNLVLTVSSLFPRLCYPSSKRATASSITLELTSIGLLLQQRTYVEIFLEEYLSFRWSQRPRSRVLACVWDCEALMCSKRAQNLCD